MLNTKLTEKSQSLNDYSLFVHKVRAGTADEMIFEEVVNMLLSEWNMDDALEVAREEGYEDGIQRGMERGYEKSDSVKNNGLLY